MKHCMVVTNVKGTHISGFFSMHMHKRQGHLNNLVQISSG